MSNNKKIARRVSRLLRLLAEKIERNPEIIEELELNKDILIEHRKKEETKQSSIDFDIFQVFAEGTKQALRQKLELLDVKTLRNVIRQHGFDPSKLAEKWKNKERLINLIIERVAARHDKGKVFKEYP
jgi:hypothetical protein